MDGLLAIGILLVGAAAGALLVWLVLRSRAALATAAAAAAHAVERAGLEQRINDQAKDREEQTAHVRQLEAETTRLRDSLESAKIEVSQLAERAARIPELEQELGVRAVGLVTLRERCAELATDKGRLEILAEERARQATDLSVQVSALNADLEALRTAGADQGAKIAELTTSLAAERQQTDEKLALLLAAKEQLSDQFKTVANEIFEDKSKRFADQNQTALTQLLDPLKTKLQEFQGKVEEVYVQEGKDRVALGEQVKQLLNLNQQLSQDALNLTRALKGDAKTQGNWGEVLLERILETAGLRKGQEYDRQTGHQHPDGSRAILDVVVYLPDDRHLVIDSKVSLKAYEIYANAESDVDRASALADHLDSVGSHIKGLSVKAYQDVFRPGSPDFVVMFVPVEPAFLLAIGEDPGLWQMAWDKSVLLVSPSTLLFVIRTVAYLWRQEQQRSNAQDIAARGALLYDKFVGFVEDLMAVGQRLTQAQQAHDDAIRKLSSGQGSLIGQAEKLRRLGVKPKKGLPAPLVDQSDTADELEPDSEIEIDASILQPPVPSSSLEVADEESKPATTEEGTL